MGSPVLQPVPPCQLRASLRPARAGCLPRPALGGAGSFRFSVVLASDMVARPAIAKQKQSPRTLSKSQCFFSMSSDSG
eukprot:3388212-Rhodomonas_salina.1